MSQYTNKNIIIVAIVIFLNVALGTGLFYVYTNQSKNAQEAENSASQGSSPGALSSSIGDYSKFTGADFNDRKGSLEKYFNNVPQDLSYDELIVLYQEMNGGDANSEEHHEGFMAAGWFLNNLIERRNNFENATADDVIYYCQEVLSLKNSTLIDKCNEVFLYFPLVCNENARQRLIQERYQGMINLKNNFPKDYNDPLPSYDQYTVEQDKLFDPYCEEYNPYNKDGRVDRLSHALGKYIDDYTEMATKAYEEVNGKIGQ
jgi:hypothetical protein